MQNYKLLLPLLSILRTRNLTESARELNVTQSAMSKTFRQIRQAFGDPIMVREGNQYILTSKGLQLQQALPGLMSQLDSLFKSDEVTPAHIKRTFTLAFSSFVAKSVVPIICGEIDAQAPHVSVSSLLWQEECLSDFHASDIDMVVTVAEDIPANLYGKLLGQDRFVVMFRQGHPLSSVPLTLDEYLQAKHVQVSGAVGWESHFLSVTPAHNPPLKNVFATVPSFDSAVKVLQSTNALMTAPLHIASKYIDKIKLELRDYPVALPEHKYYMLWHAKFHQDDEHKWFRSICIDLIRRDLQQRIDSGRGYIDNPASEALRPSRAQLLSCTA